MTGLTSEANVSSNFDIAHMQANAEFLGPTVPCTSILSRFPSDLIKGPEQPVLDVKKHSKVKINRPAIPVRKSVLAYHSSFI